jgi:hypothetical protein
MRDELERLAKLVSGIYAFPDCSLSEDANEIAAKIRSLADRLPTDPQACAPTLCRECGQPTMHVGTLCYACAHKTAEKEEVMQIEPGNSGYTPPVAPPPSDVGGGDQVPLPGRPAVPTNIHRSTLTRPGDWTIQEAVAIRAYAAARVAAVSRQWAEAIERSADDCAVLRQHAETAERERDEARATASETNVTIARIYEKVPSLPLSAESLDAATDALTAFCFMVGALGLDPDAILAEREEKEEDLGGLVGAELAGGES